MVTSFATWSFILLHLLLVLRVNTNEAREIPDEINVLKLHSMDDHHHDHASPSSSHMDHMNPALMVFFQLNDLKLGKTMPIYFPITNPSSSPHLLPRDEADLIPFSLSDFSYLLRYFSFSPGSTQAKAMENTLRNCQIPPIEGETKFCATSLESMLDFTSKIFGSDSRIKVISTTHITKSDVVLQNYTISESPREIPAPKMVACHTMPYPYAIFYCHYQESESKVFKVRLDGENGDKVEALAVCHMDTSRWSPNHVSFRVLGIEPGSSNVCHFFPADNLVSVPTSNHVSY